MRLQLHCARRMPRLIIDRFINLKDGIRLHYRESPGPHERSVVLLHSSSLHARMWDATASELAKDGYRVIALDQRGSGESDRAPSYSLELFVQVLINVSVDAPRIRRDTGSSFASLFRLTGHWFGPIGRARIGRP